MIRFKLRYAILYLTGICLLIFGNRDLWEKIREENRRKELDRKMAEEAEIASRRPFEVQKLEYDSATGSWNNRHISFQTVHVGRVNFKAMRSSNGTRVETNDDENASDTF